MIVSWSCSMHHQAPPLTIGGTVLNESDNLDIFGVSFDSKMTFESSVRSVSRATLWYLEEVLAIIIISIIIIKTSSTGPSKKKKIVYKFPTQPHKHLHHGKLKNKLGSNQRLTTPLNLFNISRLTQCREDYSTQVWAGRKHLAKWEVLLGGCSRSS